MAVLESLLCSFYVFAVVPPKNETVTVKEMDEVRLSCFVKCSRLSWWRVRTVWRDDNVDFQYIRPENTLYSDDSKLREDSKSNVTEDGTI
jgi:hypothetical protein